MIDGLELSGEAAIPLLAALLLCWGFIRVVNDKDNPVEWWHFISTRNEGTGQERGDVNSLGMLAGVVACVFVIAWTTYKANEINFMTLGVCLVYLGGVKAFAAWLRMVAAKRYAPAAEPLPAPSQREVTHTTTDKTTTQEPR